MARAPVGGRSALGVHPERRPGPQRGRRDVVHARLAAGAAAPRPGGAGALDEARHEEDVVPRQAELLAGERDGSVDLGVGRGGDHEVALAVSRGRDKAGRWAAVSLLLALAACQGDSELTRLEEARRAQSPEARAATAAHMAEVVGADVAEDGRPTGCPPGFPLAPGYALEAGAVDRGVIATCTLRYDLGAEPLADALVVAASEGGYTLESREISRAGTVRLRFSEGPTVVRAAIQSDGQRSLVQLIARSDHDETN